MAEGHDFFSEVSSAGEPLLAAVDGSIANGRTKRRYFRTVRQVFEKLSQVHDLVVDVAVDVSQAKDLTEARERVGLLDQMGLEDAIRAEDLCDELDRLGHELRPIIEGVGGLSDADKELWRTVYSELELREERTAELYASHLVDLYNIPYSESSISTIKEKVDRITLELATQKAEFEVVAKRARSMSRRRG
jgi:hypothetical protein